MDTTRWWTKNDFQGGLQYLDKPRFSHFLVKPADYGLSILGENWTYQRKYLLWISVAETSLVSTGTGGAKSGENDNLIGMLVEHVFPIFQCKSYGRKRHKWMIALYDVLREAIVAT